MCGANRPPPRGRPGRDPVWSRPTDCQHGGGPDDRFNSVRVGVELRSMTAVTEQAPAPATNPWIPAGVLMAGSVMVVLDTTIVNVALHPIGTELHATDGVEWIITAYLLAVCLSQPATGWLANRFGGRQVFLWSIAAFTVASAGCAASPTLGVLIAWRAVQGFGGGAVMPVSMAL